MLLHALLCQVKGVTPGAKYFLTRFVQCFGVTDPVGLGVKELAKEFGLTDRQVSEALATLKACNVLSYVSSAVGRGRPKRWYSLESTFLRKISKCPQSTKTPHITIIENLLKHERKDRSNVIGPKVEGQRVALDKLSSLRAKRQPGRLSIMNRLLLGVLLCHADRLGAVRNLGFAELRKVTGLAQESLKHRVQWLVDQGFIRAYVPGATGRAIFGRAKSVYFLNLSHPELLDEHRAALVLISTTSLALEKHILDESETLYSASSSNDFRAWHDQSHMANRVSKITSLFPARERRRISPLLQSRLEHYASALLSECWAQLPSSDCFIGPPPVDLIPWLLESIATEFRPSLEANSSRGLSAEQCRALLIDQLYEDAFRLACRVKHWFSGVDGIPFDTLDYLILPHGRKGSKKYLLSYSVLALSKGSPSVRGCYIVSDEGEPQCYEHEAEIPLNDRYRYGLLTKPSGKASSPGP